LVSLVITTAAAPSFSGQALPAVTVPLGRKTGLSWLIFSYVVPGRGPSSVLTVVPSGSVTGTISRSKNPLLMASSARFVLGGLTHRDVDVGDVVVFAGIVPILGALGGGRRALRRLIEERVLGVGQRVRAALDESGHRLDAGRDEGVALAGLDRVESHPDGLQRRRTIPVDGRAGQEVVAELDGDHAGHVEALLAARQAAAQDQVVDLVGIERLHLVECGAHHLGRQVVGSDTDQRPFHGAPDGRTGS
jgi:hypothetical protein